MEKDFLKEDELKAKVQSIRRKVVASRNGVISDTMKNYGVEYSVTYGVEIPRLRKIAAEYEQDELLAQHLWQTKIREMMILATLLQPKETFTFERAEAWMNDVANMELVEQLCMNLFAGLSFADKLSFRLIASERIWNKITGFTLAARIWKNFGENDTNQLIDLAFKNSKTEIYNLYHSVSLCLCRLCRRGIDVASLIQSRLNDLDKASDSEKYLFDQVSAEIYFLNY